MNFKEICKLSWRNLLRQKRRSLTTLFITGLGTMGILVFAGFAQYTYDSLAQAAARDTGNLILAHPKFFDKQEDTPLQYGLTNPKSLIRKIEAHPEVRMALPTIEFSGLISNGEKSTIFMGKGMETDEFYVKGPFLIITHGQTLSIHPQQPEVLLGQDLAKNMNVTLGDEVTLMSTTVDGTLNAIDYTVVGIVTTGIPEVDKRLVLTHLSQAQALLATDKVSKIMVFLSELEQTQPLLTTLKSEFPNYAWRQWEDLAFFYHKVRDLYNVIFGMIGIVVLLLVFFSVINTMTMAMMERIREMGTLRALGTYKRELLSLFFTEGLFIGILGAGLGILLNIGIWLFLNFVDIQMPPPPGRSEGYPLYILLDPKLMLIMGTLLALISAIAALWAAKRGVKKSIVEALGYV